MLTMVATIFHHLSWFCLNLPKGWAKPFHDDQAICFPHHVNDQEIFLIKFKFKIKLIN